MTNHNNLDDFDQDGLEPLNEPSKTKTSPGFVASVTEAWQTRPLFKLVVIMIVVAMAIFMSLSLTSSPQAPGQTKLVKTPDLNEPPGGKSSPYFDDQNRLAANQRAEAAMQGGGSAIPTPVGQSVDMSDLDKKNDPLVEFRAETERLKQQLKKEQEQNAQQIQMMQKQTQVVQPAPQPEVFDEALAQAMQRQMQTLMQSWAPTPIRVVTGTANNAADKERQAALAGNTSSDMGTSSSSSLEAQATARQQALLKDKVLVPAGTINYGQLLLEANSDVPGTILAQIVSGPFAGGRAVGAFTVQGDYLVLKFSLVSFRDKDYAVNILAVNPNTTLGGMATEVDQRYLTRLVLPAAGSFMQAFGSALGQGSSTTTVSNGTVISDQASKGYKDGLYAGMGQAGQTVSQFFMDKANRTKPLVRIASGTPMGLFFVTSVRENAAQTAAVDAQNPQPGLMNRYGAQGYGAQGYGQTGYDDQAAIYDSNSLRLNPTGSSARLFGTGLSGYGTNGATYGTGVRSTSNPSYYGN